MSYEELLMSQIVAQEVLTRLLVEKGIENHREDSVDGNKNARGVLMGVNRLKVDVDGFVKKLLLRPKEISILAPTGDQTRSRTSERKSDGTL